MASTPINRALGEIRGTVANYVFRLVEGNVVIARRPRPRDRTPSEAQLEVKTRFKRGSAYTAKVFADPTLKQWQRLLEHHANFTRGISVETAGAFRLPARGMP